MKHTTLKRKPFKRSKTSLKKKADALHSRYIRQKYADPVTGLVKCYTCPNVNHWKKMQCGHFVPRQYLSVRYEDKNTHVQCYACNMLYNGQPSVYALNLERDYGVGTVVWLESQRTVLQPNFDYESVISRYAPRTL